MKMNNWFAAGKVFTSVGFSTLFTIHLYLFGSLSSHYNSWTGVSSSHLCSRKCTHLGLSPLEKTPILNTSEWWRPSTMKDIIKSPTATSDASTFDCYSKPEFVLTWRAFNGKILFLHLNSIQWFFSPAASVTKLQTYQCKGSRLWFA